MEWLRCCDVPNVCDGDLLHIPLSSSPTGKCTKAQSTYSTNKIIFVLLSIKLVFLQEFLKSMYCKVCACVSALAKMDNLNVLFVKPYSLMYCAFWSSCCKLSQFTCTSVHSPDDPHYSITSKEGCCI
jgi:hypothetical protein